MLGRSLDERIKNSEDISAKDLILLLGEASSATKKQREEIKRIARDFTNTIAQNEQVKTELSNRTVDIKTRINEEIEKSKDKYNKDPNLAAGIAKNNNAAGALAQKATYKSENPIYQDILNKIKIEPAKEHAAYMQEIQDRIAKFEELESELMEKQKFNESLDSLRYKPNVIADVTKKIFKPDRSNFEKTVKGYLDETDTIIKTQLKQIQENKKVLSKELDQANSEAKKMGKDLVKQQRKEVRKALKSKTYPALDKQPLLFEHMKSEFAGQKKLNEVRMHELSERIKKREAKELQKPSIMNRQKIKEFKEKLEWHDKLNEKYNNLEDEISKIENDEDRGCREKIYCLKELMSGSYQKNRLTYKEENSLKITSKEKFADRFNNTIGNVFPRNFKTVESYLVKCNNDNIKQRAKLRGEVEGLISSSKKTLDEKIEVAKISNKNMETRLEEQKNFIVGDSSDKHNKARIARYKESLNALNGLEGILSTLKEDKPTPDYIPQRKGIESFFHKHITVSTEQRNELDKIKTLAKKGDLPKTTSKFLLHIHEQAKANAIADNKETIREHKQTQKLTDNKNSLKSRR